MKEHPIIFSTDMVKAILDGKKTQTRRIIPLTKKGWYRCPAVKSDLDPNTWQKEVIEVEGKYGKVGDRLWVRESFCNYIPLKKSLNIHTDGGQEQVIYKASHRLQNIEGFGDIVLKQDLMWKPSIFMPRWASRITLEITDIRVERLQSGHGGTYIQEGYVNQLGSSNPAIIQNWFQNLWNSIHKKQHRWEDNPWVWVIGFKRNKQ